MERKSSNLSLVESQRLDDIAAVLEVITHWMAMPLFALFWIADILYVPHLKYPFLFIRVVAVPASCFLVTYMSRRTQTSNQLQRLASLYAGSVATAINVMIFMIDDPSTPYYAGLNLVALGALSFIPLSWNYWVGTALAIYGPYYAIVLSQADSFEDYRGLVISSFFILGTICMCSLIRHFHSALRVRELDAKTNLKEELASREKIIRSKTEEAVRLNALSSQFSPQIVESIRNGALKLDVGSQRTSICAIFIDIVNSTEKVTRIDKEKVERVLSKFLDDTIKILLKYDITIDKFLGDGILGFCNAPLPRQDYVARVVSAALEIRQHIENECDYYEKYWLSRLSIRIGIAKGYVNVGFYGSQKYYRSFTAIGPAVNLASRLCNSADPDQIVVDQDVYEDIQQQFNTTFLGKRTLKGFNDDLIHVYSVQGPKGADRVKSGLDECPQCGSLMSLETDSKGLFYFKCKSCGNGGRLGAGKKVSLKIIRSEILARGLALNRIVRRGNETQL